MSRRKRILRLWSRNSHRGLFVRPVTHCRVLLPVNRSTMSPVEGEEGPQPPVPPPSPPPTEDEGPKIELEWPEPVPPPEPKEREDSYTDLGELDPRLTNPPAEATYPSVEAIARFLGEDQPGEQEPRFQRCWGKGWGAWSFVIDPEGKKFYDRYGITVESLKDHVQEKAKEVATEACQRNADAKCTEDGTACYIECPAEIETEKEGSGTEMLAYISEVFGKYMQDGAAFGFGLAGRGDPDLDFDSYRHFEAGYDSTQEDLNELLTMSPEDLANTYVYVVTATAEDHHGQCMKPEDMEAR